MMSQNNCQDTRETSGVKGQVAGSSEKSSEASVYVIPLTVFVLLVAASLGILYAVLGTVHLLFALLAVLFSALVASSIHIAQEWERIVVLRLGKFNRIAGPGLFLTIPFIESCAIRVDQRIRITSLKAEETLTADLVPVDVNAVMYWMVWGVREACFEVLDFNLAVENAGQAALRDAIGRSTAAEIVLRREQLDSQLQEKLENQVDQWGVTIILVSLIDIVVPKSLQDTMSSEAQAEQRSKARIALAESERSIFDILEEVGTGYKDNPEALKLRAMHLLYESIKDSGGTVVVPSSFSEGFGDIFSDKPAK